MFFVLACMLCHLNPFLLWNRKREQKRKDGRKDKEVDIAL